jgi:two-component system NarL family sensor kinase
MWRLVRRAVGRYQELVLAVTFLGMAAYEAAEMWMLEGPGASPLALSIHALQVALILAATAVAFRAWRRKTAHEEALARLVERVVFAKDEERRRIAYELHDGISPLIVSAQQHLDTSRDLLTLDPTWARTQLDTGVARLDLAIVEMRRVLSGLQPSVVAARGLGPAARQSLEETATETGWAVAFHEDLGEARLPAAVETAAFRILQEALANVRRHARTERVEVELQRRADWLYLDVRDYGVGLPADEGRGGRGLGLLSMQERADLVGGICAIENATDRGTRVRAQLPLRPAGGSRAAAS